MRQITRLAAFGALFAVVTAANADSILRQREFDLSRAGDPSAFTLYKTQVLGIGSDDEGLTQAQLYFPQDKASFGRSSTTSYEDWSPYNLVCVKIANRENFTVEFRMLVYLRQNASDSTGVYSGRIRLGPRETRRFICHLNPDDGMPYGLEYMKPVLSAEYTSIYSSGGFRDLRTIYHWRLSYQGTRPARVDFSDLRLIKQNLDFTNMVDRFGQYTDRDWAGKIRTDSDLLTRKAEELNDIEVNSVSGETFGTSQLINEQPQPGRWAVVTQSSGKKYLQHPNGKLFWVLGISNVHNGTATPVQGRESFFEYLPKVSTASTSNYSLQNNRYDGQVLSYNFTEQNLRAKYGSDYRSAWANHVKTRLTSWGLNALGMQCLGEFYDNSIPYTVIVKTNNFPTRLKVPYMLWGTFPDAYDPAFESWATTEFAKELVKHAGNQNMMGVFVDNELSWGNTFEEKRRYNLMLGTLKSSSTQPAKVELVQWLQRKYKTIDDLNAYWESSIPSFDWILYNQYQPTTFSYGFGMDSKRWTRQFAAAYHGKVRNALMKAGLQSLYLGCRYADWTPEAVETADKYVDVHTFNTYRTVPYINWAFYNRQLKKPVLFSEVGYSVQGGGTFGGPGEVSSQQERADNLKWFLETAHDQPNVVGAILFCYNDQPVTGRWSDYENSGLGLVDITDTPHYEAVNMLRQFAKSMYLTRG